MASHHLTIAVFVIAALFACSSGDDSKNDLIAACVSSGGRWVEGCGGGQCERTNGASPDDPFARESADAASAASTAEGDAR